MVKCNINDNFKNVKPYEGLLIKMIIFIFFMMNICSTQDNISRMERNFLSACAITSMILVYSITTKNLELTKRSHDLFFYLMATSLIPVKSKMTLCLLLFVYLFMLLTRFYFKVCFIRFFSKNHYKPNASMRNYNIIMISYSLVILYKIIKK